MDFHFERRASASALWARRISTFSAVLLLTAAAGHRYGAVDTIPLFWLLGLVALLALLALLLAAVGYARLWTYGDKGGRASTRAVIVALLVLLPFAYGGYRAVTLPRLTDVSTDVVDPPGFVAAPRLRGKDANPVRPYDGALAAGQMAAYPAATGRRYSQPADRLVEIVLFTLADLGWPLTYRGDPQALSGESRVEAAARSLVLGLVSDFALRIVDEGESTYVDARSNSRYGPHDLGDNAAKIVRFFDTLDAEVTLRNLPVNVED